MATESAALKIGERICQYGGSLRNDLAGHVDYFIYTDTEHDEITGMLNLVMEKKIIALNPGKVEDMLMNYILIYPSSYIWTIEELQTVGMRYDMLTRDLIAASFKNETSYAFEQFIGQLEKLGIDVEKYGCPEPVKLNRGLYAFRII